MTRAIITSASLNVLIVVALLAIAAAVPAAMVQGHAPENSKTTMHGGTPAWGEQYHLIVALFERASGKRIDDARVKATLFNTSRPGNRLAGTFKDLEPMLVGGAATYGNYFNIPAPAPYRIDLEVVRPGKPETTKASFEYRHALVTTRPRR